MSRVFLSHSSKDKNYVRQIADKFGKDIAIFDEYSFELGLQTFDEILKNLNTTDLFVIFISESALESKWVKEELNKSYDLFKKETLKQIFPIIIDPAITHQDKRIPEWMKTGFESFNLRFVSNPKIAYRKIKNQLASFAQNDYKRPPYIGNDENLSEFQNAYYNSEEGLRAIVSCGIEGIGREAFIRQCLKRCQSFASYFDPIVLTLGYNDSIEDLILKLIETGYCKQEADTLTYINQLVVLNSPGISAEKADITLQPCFA